MVGGALAGEWDAFKRMVSRVMSQGGPNALFKATTLSCIFIEARIKERIRIQFRKTKKTMRGKTGIGAIGHLSSAWAHEVKKHGLNRVTGIVGTWAKHAAIHEYGSAGLPGGAIRPVNVAALTIPIGSKPYPPANILRHQGLTFLKDGIIFFHQRPKKDHKPIPIYVLKQQVRIPANPYIRPTIQRYGPDIQKFLGASIKEIISKGK
ncbi:MAG: hypothetical protein KKD77_21030 [Gammaproteobacteria bacterium]|nr:hypothetical protein [Gammaproteobacteria bacterium]